MPFGSLELMESFFVPNKLTHEISGHIYYAKKKLKRNFISRKWTEAGIEGTRVWRVEENPPMRAKPKFRAV